MADLAIVTAVGGSGWESQLVSTIDRAPGGLYVARRCVDVADLLATAAAGHGSVILLSADFRRLDRDVVSQLYRSGVAVVGVVLPESAPDVSGRMRQLGIHTVIRADVTPEQLADSLQQAVTQVAAEGRGDFSSHSAESLDVTGSKISADGVGRVIAVWGPYGAPGRTTLAVNVANELARLGYSTLLVDADMYGGSVTQMLGLLDEVPGLAGAARSANNGNLDPVTLATYERTVIPDFRVLTGLVRPARWREVRPSALEVVFNVARRSAQFVVVDAGFCLDLDDATPLHRNGVTLAALEHADQVVAVGSSDPIGLGRLAQGISDLREFVSATPIDVVINRLRSGAGGSSERQITAALWRYANVQPLLSVPDDRDAFDAALAQGLSLAEVAPDSRARHAFRDLARHLAGLPAIEDDAADRIRRSLSSWRSLGRVVQRR